MVQLNQIYVFDVQRTYICDISIKQKGMPILDTPFYFTPLHLQV
jgi:hypothetical protein|nr:MAG TPA: hypothetical protein [Caudoviricetes sp.]